MTVTRASFSLAFGALAVVGMQKLVAAAFAAGSVIWLAVVLRSKTMAP